MGNSSGIAAIARLTAPSNARVQGSPRARLSPNSAIATMTATTPRRRTRTPACCCRGRKELRVRRRFIRGGWPLAFWLRLGFAGQGGFVDRQVCDPTDDAVSCDDVPFAEDEEVSRDNLLEWDGHDLPVADDVR